MDAGYDVPQIASYLDWINVMTYDYHGQWDKKTGHVAPMYEHPDDDFYFFNAVSSNASLYLFLWNLDKLSNGCSHRYRLSTELNCILGTFKREL